MRKPALMYVYDDRAQVSPIIAQIVGDCRYGQIIHQRQRLHAYVRAMAEQMDADVQFHHVHSREGLTSLLERAGHQAIYYQRASIVPRNPEVFTALISKALLSTKEVAHIRGQQVLGLLVHSGDKLRHLLRSQERRLEDDTLVKVTADYVYDDISSYQECLAFFASVGFESRHFNTLSDHGHSMTKSSKDAAKLRAEYDYYYLLPDAMKHWFVMPFHFRRENSGASYQMEKLLIPDVGLQWVHDALPIHAFNRLLDQLLGFIDERPRKKVGTAVFSRNRDALYIDKVKKRFEALRGMPTFSTLDAFVAYGTAYGGIEAMIEAYLGLYAKHHKHKKQAAELAVSHGDLCFSNMLYEKNIALLRFIDPRGATTEEELWQHPAYDVAKLSHSVLGDYDWINHGLFTIQLEDSNRLTLHIDADLTALRLLKQRFLDRMEEAGFDTYTIRLYEVSLFLSMLPLHGESQRKMLAFLLRAASILEELQNWESNATAVAV